VSGDDGVASAGGVDAPCTGLGREFEGIVARSLVEGGLGGDPGVHGVGGWVTNRGDGSVEAWFEGTPTAVDAMIAWCRVGPRWADVTDVSVAEWVPEGRRSFSIR